METINLESSTLMYLLVITLVLLIAISTFGFILYKKLKELNLVKTQLENTIVKLKAPMGTDDIIKYLNIFDKLLLTKFNYYIHVHFLANFEKKKEISKEAIKNIKQEFYVDVSSTLRMEQKYKLLDIFSDRGIELYIHQFFLQKLNELDVKYKKQDESVKDNTPADSLMKEIYKG